MTKSSDQETDSGLVIRYPFWELTARRADISQFLRSLPTLFGEDCGLALDDVTAEDIRDFISSREPSAKPKLLALDVDNPYWLLQFVRPFVEKRRKRPMYMRMSAENLQGLAEFLEHHDGLEVCGHLVVYRGSEVLMEYNDVAPRDAQVRVASSIDEEQVKAFCEAVGFRYSWAVYDQVSI